MVNKWIEKAGNSKYGSKVNEVLAGANENLKKASDFVSNVELVIMLNMITITLIIGSTQKATQFIPPKEN